MITLRFGGLLNQVATGNAGSEFSLKRSPDFQVWVPQPNPCDLGGNVTKMFNVHFNNLVFF